MTDPDLPQKPVLTSLPDRPTFIGTVKTGQHFLCTRCGKILIENYIEASFVGIGFKCLRCEETTYTPDHDLGDVLTASPLIVSDKSFLTLGSISYSPQVVAIGEGHAADVLRACIPRSNPGPDIDCSPSGLSISKTKYNHLFTFKPDSKNSLAAQSRAVSTRKSSAKYDFPFIWAIDRLNEAFAPKTDAKLTEHEYFSSLMMYYLMNHAVFVWGHNPRFPEIGFGLVEPGKFIHTGAQLVLAAHLWSQQLMVGLTREINPNRPNPDLYIKGSGTATMLYCEVKAPKALQWQSGPTAPLDVIKKCVLDQFKKSKDQITRQHPGILCIASTKLQSGMLEMLKQCIGDMLSSYGSENPHVDKVIGMTPAMVQLPSTTGRMIPVPFEWNFSYSDNPSYSHERFIGLRTHP